MPNITDWVKWLKDHWFILAAVASGATAWANQQNKIEVIAERQAQIDKYRGDIQQQTEKVDTIKETVIRQDEQIKSLNKQLEMQNLMLRALIESDPRAQQYIRQNKKTIPTNTP